MSTLDMDEPFDTIESAQEFMNVLAATVLDVMKELNSARTEALNDSDMRRVRALELSIYNLKMLGCYVHKSRRALNDLRILRRLIMNERTTVASIIATI